MTAHLRRCLFIILAAMLLTVSAFADFGPKPQLVIRVENAPEELYYLDLLEEGALPEDNNNRREDEDVPLSPELLDILEAAVPEGWHACTVQGTGGAPIWGDLMGKDGVHTFGYHGVPRTFRILIATQSGQTWISDSYTRTVLQSSVTVDWPTKEVAVPAVWVGYLLQFLATFVPTILLEGLLLAAFRLANRRNWCCFLLVNLITQGALAVYCSITFLQSGFNSMFLVLFIPMELAITLAETLLYRRWLTGTSLRSIILYAISANVLSAAAGWFLAEPVWQFVVSIS